MPSDCSFRGVTNARGVTRGRTRFCSRNGCRWVIPVLLLVITLLPGSAAAGRLTLETDHFLIHFDENLEVLARHAAVIAEEVHHELVPRIAHAPAEKTHLVLLDETDLANGFADPLMYPKITIYPVSPTFLAQYSSGISPRLSQWLRLVILHEYAHALHLDMNAGFGKLVEHLFGRVPLATNPNFFQGPAFIEGFATYHETIAKLGGRGDDPYYRMFLRTMVLEDDILQIDQILGHYPLERWKPGAAAYLYGYSLWGFMAERYGEASLQRFNEAFARTASMDAAFREALGITPTSFYDEWRHNLRSRFTEEVNSLRRAGTTPTEPLGGLGYVPETPIGAPNGAVLAYSSTSGPIAPALRVIEWKGATMGDRQLVAGLVIGPIAWSPDGTQLYYAKVDAEGTGTWSDLYRYDMATGKEQRLTRGLRALGPAPSPDNRRLVFTSRAGLETRLMELDLDRIGPLPVREGNPALRELLPAAGEAQRLAAGWFPDGRSILVSSHEPGGGMDLLRLDPASGELTPLVAGSQARGGAGIVNENPQFTPDGRFILFDSDRTGVYNLYAYELATGDTFTVARSLTGLFDPTLLVTDAGTMIVAMEYTAKGYRLSRLPYDPESWDQIAGIPDTAGGIRAPNATALAGTPDPIGVARGPVTSEIAGRPDTTGVTGAPDTTGIALGPMRPYSPWSSLRPRFFLPLVGADEGGPVFGASTYGYDAFQERVYSVAVGYGSGSGRPLVNIQYSGPLGNRQTVWALQLVQETSPDDDGNSGTLLRGVVLEASHTWPRLLSSTTLRAQTAFMERQRVQSGEPNPVTSPHQVQAFSVGLAHLRDWPVDDRNVLLDSRLTLTGLREGASRQSHGYVATWQETANLSWNLRRTILDATLTLGTSTFEDGFTLGSSSPTSVTRTDWSLNSPGPYLSGRHAARLVVGLNRQLLHIGRGIGTVPFFLDDVGGRLYVEGGSVWSSLDDPPASRLGLGAETSLTAYAAYNVPITLALGAAVGLDHEERPVTLYVRLVLDDVLGGAWRR